MSQLILVRHGQSEWNEKGLWTGRTDIPLSETGKQEAIRASEAIKDIAFSACFTSKLKRAQETLRIILQELHLTNIPTFESEALNERDYGIYTGKNKWDVQKEIGDEEFFKLRRSWNYPIQKGESLSDVYERVEPYYLDNILPYIRRGESILLAAHGNSIRALIKHLDHIPDEKISEVEIRTGEVHMYTLDTSGKVISKEIRATNTTQV